MIAQLSGKVARIEPGIVVLDVAGVGYMVNVVASVTAKTPDVGMPVILHTHLVVREDDLSLYGFATVQELLAFKLLISASGVGPRVALALLSTLSVDELARAVAGNDTKTVALAPGVGPRLAQRICLEIGDKLAAIAIESRVASVTTVQSQSHANGTEFEDAVEALVSLGFARLDARRAAERVIAQSETTNLKAAVIIHAAIKILSDGGR